MAKTSDRSKRGTSLPKCFEQLLRATLKADLGKAQSWFNFIYASYPKAQVEQEFKRLFEKEF